MAETIRQRPGTMRLIDATHYRLPAAGWVSILHRVSGLLLFVLMPFIIWMFDTSVSSEISAARLRHAFSGGALGFFLKLVALALIWAYLHHFAAGIRHLFMDMHMGLSKEGSRHSAASVLAISLFLTLLVALKLFGVF